MQNFHEDYKIMLGKEFMDSIRANPYDSTNTKSDSSGSASPAFKKRKGMAQHRNEMQRERSHKTLQYHLRNDDDFIQKVEKDNEWYVKPNGEQTVTQINIPSLPLAMIEHQR